MFVVLFYFLKRVRVSFRGGFLESGQTKSNSKGMLGLGLRSISADGIWHFALPAIFAR